MIRLSSSARAATTTLLALAASFGAFVPTAYAVAPSPVSPASGSTVQATDAIDYVFSTGTTGFTTPQYFSVVFSHEPTVDADGELLHPIAPGEDADPPEPSFTSDSNPFSGQTDLKMDVYGPHDPGVYYWQAIRSTPCAPDDPCVGPVAKVTILGPHPHLSLYGSKTYHLPVPKRVYAFNVLCRNTPCSVRVNAHALIAGHRVATFDTPTWTINADSPEDNIIVFHPNNLKASKLRSALTRHISVRYVISAAVTDSAGLKTSRSRSLIFKPALPKAKPRPKHKATTIERVTAAVTRAIRHRAIGYFVDRCYATAPKQYECKLEDTNPEDPTKYVTATVAGSKIYVGSIRT